MNIIEVWKLPQQLFIKKSDGNILPFKKNQYKDLHEFLAYSKIERLLADDWEVVKEPTKLVIDWGTVKNQWHGKMLYIPNNAKVTIEWEE